MRYRGSRAGTVVLALVLATGFSTDVRIGAQGKALVPDLAKVATGQGWKVVGRTATAVEEDGRKGVRFDEQPSAGVAWLVGADFGDGVIDVDLKGQNVPQRSFLGMAFRLVDEETYDAVYFRPFNFKNPAELNRSHGVQYISHPVHTWQKLRADTPGVYEHAVEPVPDPDGWFHARLVVTGSRVQVYVNDASAPSLTVETLNDRRGGPVGLWVGNGSGGAFANLTITPAR